MPEGGRASLRLHVPAWTMPTLSSCVALVFLMVGFCGFQLQALYGLRGSRMIALGGRDQAAQRFVWFDSSAPEREGPSRAELRRRIAKQRATELHLGDRRAAGLLLIGAIAPEWADAARHAAPSDGSLMWPVRQGAYGRGWGSGQDGYHLAIDIEGERGADVLAAAPGVVGYAGNELHGYGNVIMIVHPGNRVTLYGHNQKNLVIAGERVYQGQVIAELGSTGRSMGPHVHFELKYDGRNCDPMPLVRAASSSVERMPVFTPVTWSPDQPRPERLRCALRRMHPSADPDEGLVGDAAKESTQAATKG